MPEVAFFGGQIVPTEDAKISIRTHAFNYGTAVFEGIRGNWNADEGQMYLFRLKEHYTRLLESARILNISVTHSVDEMCEITRKLVQKSEFKQDIYVRPIAYKSDTALGLRIHDLKDDFLIYVIPFGNYLESDKGIRCCVSSWTRIDDTMVPPRAKINGLYVNGSLAKTEAIWRGFDEAIMLTRDGHVAEGSGENIFLIRNKTLITPDVSDNILEGITKDTIIELAQKELGMPVVQRRVNRSELLVADEVFMTGTAAHLTPVVSIDGRDVADGGIGPVTARLQEMYFDIVKGKDKRYIAWCTPAYSPAVSAR